MNASAQRIGALLLERFAGRTDCYLRERNGNILTVKEPLTDSLFESHLRGIERIGLFPNGETLYLGFDFDGKNPKAAPRGADAAWADLHRVAAVLDADLGFGAPTAEVTRSRIGYRLLVFFDPADAPTVAEAKALGLAVLRAAGLPDDEDEDLAHAEVYPHPGGEGGYGNTCFLPLGGILNGGASRFLELSTREPIERQEGVLESPRLLKRSEVLRALEALAEVAPAEPKQPIIPRPSSSSTATAHSGDALDLAAWLARHAIETKNPRTRDGLELLDIRCPLNPDHGFDAWVGQDVDGKLSAGCHHATCSLKSWRDLRDRYEPRRAATKTNTPEEPAWIHEEDDGEAEAEAAPVEASEPEATPEPEPDPDETPALPESLWRPGFSEFRAGWGHTTESPDAFLWSAYFVSTAAVLGRNPSLALGVDVRANVNVANLGRSGGARKSTGQAKADRLLDNVDQGVTVLHGIGSPEGLIEVLGGETGIPRRVLVNVNELSTLLRKGAQEATRGLAPLLCTLYDCPPSVTLPNRKKPLEAREPFLCVIGSTTPDWLRADLTVNDVRGGLAGRFCYFVGTPKAPIPLPPAPDAVALTEAEHILLAARERSVSQREYSIDADAAELFSAWYYAERAREYPNPILDTLAQRLHVFAWKATLMFAVLEGTDTVTGEQMAAALAFADYQRETQAAIFGTFGKSALQQTIDRVVAAVKKHGPLSPRDITQKVRHVEYEVLSKALPKCCQLGLLEERVIGRKRVLALPGQRFGNGSGNGTSKGKR